MADIKAAVDTALAEDLGTGDITTGAMIPADTRINLVMATRQDIVVAGLGVALEVFNRLAPDADVSLGWNSAADDIERFLEAWTAVQAQMGAADAAAAWRHR